MSNAMGHMKELDIRIRSGGDDAVAAACELLPRWIPVSERLPDDETELLVAFEDRSLGVAFAVFHHLDKNWKQKWTDGNGIELKQPTHWMPLPAPPSQ